VPEQFSWVDHRLVRDKFITRCSTEALALYLLLVCVGDAEGLSYYSDRSIDALISIGEASVAAARRELIKAGLIAYEYPLYQVLSLDRSRAPDKRGCKTTSIAEILKGLSKGDAQ